MLNRERHEWIRFVNPSDMRVAPVVCGRCHDATIRSLQKGPMMNSAQVYSTALYNNSSVPFKDAQFAENYTPRGEPQIIRTLRRQLKRRRGSRAFFRSSSHCHASKWASPGISSVSSSEAAGRNRRWATRTRGRAGPAGRDPEQSRLRHPGLRRSRDPRRAEDAAARSDPLVSRHQRSPGDYRVSGCTALPRRLRQRPRPFNSGPYAQSGNRGHARPAPTRRSRRTSRATRSSTSSRARSRRASA